MRRAIAQWYENRFGVKLDSDKEVLPLIGAKEGIGHVAFCFLDPGDIALAPDPAYPVYGVGTMFAGAESYIMPAAGGKRVAAGLVRRYRRTWRGRPR